MYLYSADNLHAEIKNTQLYKSKRPSEKPVFIDKCNWLIHTIYEQNRHKHKHALFKFQGIPLHKNILQSIIGSTEYLKVIQTLTDLGYITVNHSYKSQSFIDTYNKKRLSEGKEALKHLAPECKKYALTDKSIDKITSVGVLSSRMRKKIRKYKEHKIKQYSNDKTHKRILNSITKVKFNSKHPKALKALQDNKDIKTAKGKYYSEVYKELQELNKLDSVNELSKSDAFYYVQSDKVNRVFHYHATIPKAFRESLTLKSGGNLSEIDLRNSQPLIIALNYLNTDASNLSKPDNERLLKDVLSGTFYASVANQALKDGDIETYNLFTDNYSKFKAQVLGDGLYFNYIPQLDKAKPTERYLYQLYPNFMRYVRNLKRLRGYESVSIEAQLIESSIFIDGLYKNLTLDDVAIPVHDSIIIPTTQEDFYLNKLITIFKSKFQYLDEKTIKGLFRITEY